MLQCHKNVFLTQEQKMAFKLKQHTFYHSSICILCILLTKISENIKQKLNLRLGVLICLDMVSIETLNLDVVKEWVSTVEKISTASKS